MRGKRSGKVFQQSDTGITPAGAGKTAVVKQAAAIAWDHPRRCGENYEKLRKAKNIEGSPPQVRGKLAALPQIITSIGITPAGAGKTSSRLSHTSLPQDHPRRCGENCHFFPPAIRPAGSPPQVRGKLCENLVGDR